MELVGMNQKQFVAFSRAVVAFKDYVNVDRKPDKKYQAAKEALDSALRDFASLVVAEALYVKTGEIKNGN